jgi:deoxyribodipyrimidine photo-lyase
MHNRARLVVGSFLTKDLGIDWRWGERWFMRLLLDGDEASNNGNWQWIASVGVDPQPAFRRMFNPERQQERFDPEAAYVRRYVPELRNGNDKYVKPIVDHKSARRDALTRYRVAGSPRRSGRPRPN